MSTIISNSGKGKELSRRRTKPPREELGKGLNLCEYCTAKCCRYFTFPLEKPTTRQEFDALRWSLLHEYATALLKMENGISAFTQSVSIFKTIIVVVSIVLAHQSAVSTRLNIVNTKMSGV